MLKPFGRFNSKGFLLAYLVIVMIILAMWVFRLDKPEPEYRQLPDNLRSYLVSPPKKLPQILLKDDEGNLLTNASLQGHWSWLYFTQPKCLPECGTVLTVLHNLQQIYAATDNAFFLIDFDTDTQQSLPGLLKTMTIDFPVFTAESSQLQTLMDTLDFLYLKTPVGQGDYQIEQYHHIYLIDPKGRFYAVFKPPFTSPELQNRFVALRDFYARSE